jgi:DUF4097 and DUF4098 domain-containing protein YvlB
MKLVVEERSPDEHAHPADIIVYLPRQSSVSVKTVDAVVTAANVGGWFYSVSGAVRLSGATANAEAESMSGDIELALTTPWAKARTGRGHLMVRGSPQDVDASTISGALDIDAPSIAHGRFASVTGDIRYTASVKRDAVFEFSNHAGDVDFVLQRAASAAFDLSTVTGAIENAFTQVRPVATTPRSLRLRLGGGEAQIVVRTFKGTIRLRPR